MPLRHHGPTYPVEPAHHETQADETNPLLNRALIWIGGTAALGLLGFGVLTGGSPSAKDAGVGTEVTLPEPLVVPFQLRNDQIVFQASLGQTGPLNFILDTAAETSLVDLSTAAGAGVKVDATRPLTVNGVGDRRPLAYPARIEGLAVAGQGLPPFAGVVLDMTPLNEVLAEPLHGALGHSFLQGRAVRIDYPRGLLTLYDGAAPESSTPGRSEFELELRNDQARLGPLYIEGRPVQVILDTGAAPAVTIATTAAEGLGLGDLVARSVAGQVRGARGVAPVSRTVADSVRMGRLSLTGLEIAFAPWIHGTEALVGTGFLRHFALTVDYVRRRAILEPSP